MTSKWLRPHCVSRKSVQRDGRTPVFFIKWIKLLLQFPFHFNLSSHFFTATSNQDQSLETLSHPEFSTFYLDSNTREKKGFDSKLMIKVMRVRSDTLGKPIPSKNHTKSGNLTNYRRPLRPCRNLDVILANKVVWKLKLPKKLFYRKICF